MAERWYFGGSTSGNGVLAPYAPATFKGSWDVEPDDPDRIFSPYKIGTSSTMARSETSATAPWRVCVTRGVSPTLAAQTITGDVDIILGLNESNVAADFFTRLYIYVTQGDSDLVRGVLLDYEETSGGGATEWPTTNTGVALQAVQALTPVNALEGDRLVIEFGYRSENVSTTSRSGTVRVGARGSDLVLNADLTVGSTSTSSLAGFVEFENAINLSATEPANMTPELAIEITPLPFNSGEVDPVSATYALWWQRTITGAENDVLGTFIGVGAGGGVYTPQAQVREASGATFPIVGTGFNEDFQAYTILVGAMSICYLEVYSVDVTNPPSRNLIVSAIAAPIVPVDPANYIGDYLISEDDIAGVPFAVLIDKDTGAILAFVDVVTSENGVVADNGVFVFTDKEVLSPTENQPIIYDPDLSTGPAVLATVVGATVTQFLGGQGNVPVATDGTDFYCAQQQSSLGPAILVSQFDQTGAILNQWTIPQPTGWTFGVEVIAVSRDGSTLYYAARNASVLFGEPIKRWDLTNDLPLSDFYTPTLTSFIKDLYVLRDGSIIFNQFEAAIGAVFRYAADGTQLNAYNFSDPFAPSTGVWFVDHIAPTNDDPASFGVWFQQVNPTFPSWPDYIFRKIQSNNGTVLETIPQGAVFANKDAMQMPEPDAEVSQFYFGAPNCCPLIILGARTFTTATLTVEKIASPSDTGQAFDFTTTGGLSPATFDLLHGESEVFSGLLPGLYGVMEIVPSGWTRTSAVVSNGDAAEAITIGEGDVITVVFTNVQCPGEIDSLQPRVDGLPYTPFVPGG